jgi:predicted Ser/Thr protein kinase
MAKRNRGADKKELSGLERYAIEDEIGRGGMGVVSRAHDAQDDADVALKELVLPDDLPAEDARRAIERFGREADAAAGLNSDHIVKALGAFAEDERHFLVMEYVDGQTLDKLIATGPLDPAVAVGVAEQVLEALEVAHEAGVVHRDLKPENIFVLADGTVKVGDFGVARVASGDAKLTRAGQVLGTVGYMPPEQVRGGEVDARSDIFALGVIVYEMLIGANPFHADQPTTAMYRISYEEPPALDAFIPTMPANLTPVLTKAMAKDPALRYQSAAEMLADLRSGEAPDVSAILAAASAREAERAKADAAAAKAAKAASKPRMKLKMNRQAVIAAALAVLVIAGAGGALAYSNNKRHQEQVAQREAALVEAKAAASKIAELKAIRAQLDATVATIKSKAKSSASAATRWDEQWAAAQDRYNERVAEVNAYNASELAKQQASIPPPAYDPFYGTTTTYGPTYIAGHQNLPKYPPRPSRLKVNIGPDLAQLDTLVAQIDQIQAAETSATKSPVLMPVLHERLGSAIALLRSTAGQARATAGGLVTTDPDKGQVITADKANAFVVASTDDALQKPVDEMSLDLGNFGISLQEVMPSATP